MADYWIKRPGKGRRSWSILRREAGRAVKVDDARIELVNRLARAGTLDHAQAEFDVRAILAELQAREIPEADRPGAVNVEVAERYWREVREARPNSPDSQRSARNALERALRALGPTPLTTAPLADLQRALERVRPRGRRAAALAINALLRYLARPERVRRGRQAKPVARYATQAEFKRLLKQLPDDDARLVARVAFGTGARLGEVFALRRTMHTGSVWIDQQMFGSGEYGPVKNNKPRTATVIPTEWLAVRRWLAVSEAERRRLRTLDWAKLIAKASLEALGRRLVFHDLRHSYAIFWAQTGSVDLRKIANCLGDSLAVADVYYSTHMLTSDDESSMLKAVYASRRIRR